MSNSIASMKPGGALAREIHRHLAAVGEIGPRPDGTDADKKLVDYIERELTSLGLTVTRHPIKVSVVVDPDTRLDVLAPSARSIAAIGNLRTGLTPKAGIEAPIVFCNRAFASDVDGLDLSGKIAIAYEAVPYETDVPGEVGWHLEKIHRLRDKGALAVVFCTQRLDNEITTWGLFGLDRGIDNIAAVGIGYDDLEWLRYQCGQGRVRARLTHHGALEVGTADVLSAVLPGGKQPDEEVVFIGGHHETVPSCNGVNDNGSGIAIMLEAVRLLAARPRRRSIRFLVTCGEESGCWGSKSFLDGMDAGSRVRAVLNVDQVASSDIRLVGHGTPWLNKIIADTAGEMGLLLGTTHEEPRVASILGDAEPWWEAGHPSAMLAGWWSDPAYHTAKDTIRLVNPNYLKIWCDVLRLPQTDLRMEISPMAADTTPSPAPFVPGGKPEAVSIGINSVEWRGETLEQVLQNMQPYGLTLVELIARKNLRKEAVPQAKELLAKYGVRTNSVSAFTKLNEVVHNGVAETQELINESLEIAAMMGAPFSHTYFGANAFLNDDEAIKRYVEFIRPCLRKAEETGVTLLIDNLFDSVPEEIPATFRQHYRSSDVTRTVKGCQQLLESIDSPWFQYNYDPGNFRCSAEEPYPYGYDILRDFIRSVHLKDAVKYDRELHGDRGDLYLQRDLTGDYMCVAIGAGAVNYDAVLKRLKADGYQGSLILEPHTGDRRLDAAIKDSLAYLAGHGFVGKGAGR